MGTPCRLRSIDNSDDNLLARWLDHLPDAIDLTDEAQEARLYEVVDAIQSTHRSLERLSQLELELAARDDQAAIAVRLATKLAISRARLSELGGNLHLSVVFAIYKEQNRLRSRADHPHGENALMRKIRQLDWLTHGVQGCSWDMYVVDDGCPEHSGQIAEQILAAEHDRDNVKLLYLEQGIADKHPATAGLQSAADSQKGGSILYGLAKACEQPRDRHLAIYTDADLSTHLGQVGLLAHEVLANNRDCAAGSRRETLSVAVKRGTRNSRGKLFIYLWKRLLPALGDIIDTQCGFKAFRAEVAREIVADTVERRFAFDVELLLKTSLQRPNSVGRVAVAWIDSEAASTTTDLQPYLPMLRGIATIAERYLEPTEQATAFAAFVRELDELAWQRLVAHIPRQIALRDPGDFSAFDAVTVDQLRELA